MGITMELHFFLLDFLRRCLKSLFDDGLASLVSAMFVVC
jgi:hypothetical protein